MTDEQVTVCMGPMTDADCERWARAAGYDPLELPGSTLVLAPEAHYVTETHTGLIFTDNTPVEVWASVVTRLLTQHKRIEWAIADAINFGSRRYGEVYAQWIEQTQLAKKTLANIAWVGRSIESSRRREDVDFSYHAEVASLPPQEQDALLDAAVEQGMTRYDLRSAARERKQALEGRAVTVEGDVLDSVDLPLTLDDLTDEARAPLNVRLASMSARMRPGFAAGWVQALVWAGQDDAFRRKS